MKVSNGKYEPANARAAAQLRKTPCATKAHYERQRGNKGDAHIFPGSEMTCLPFH